MKISIIIPTFNAASTLNNALESLCYQSYKNIEVIVIDALSADETLNVIKNYEQEINIHWLSEQDNGIYDAMNKGVARAKGDWIYFLGADDCLFDESVLSTIVSHLDVDHDLVYGNTIWVPEQYIDKGTKTLSDLLQNGINHQRIFYNKSVFDKYGVYNTDYKIAADFDLNIRLFCNPAVTKKYVDVPLAYYHTGGTSASNIDYILWEHWRTVIYEKFSPFLSRKEIYGRLWAHCWYSLAQKRYGEFTRLFCRIYFNTFSYSFLKHSVSQVFKLLNKEVNP